MNLFNSWRETETTQNEKETIEKLTERLDTSEKLADQRAYILSLKSFAQGSAEIVGRTSLTTLTKALHKNRKDKDCVKALLGMLRLLCDHDEIKPELASEFTDKFIEDGANVTILVDILDPHSSSVREDPHVRLNTISFLHTLSKNRLERVQGYIVHHPMSIGILVDLLDDTSEPVFNEGLLLLIELSRNNALIQKSIISQNGFEKLFSIIDDHGGICGGLAVEDCLNIICNLLRYNHSNKKYFREMECIKEIKYLLGADSHNSPNNGQTAFSYEDWPHQKTNNTKLLLELICILIGADGVDNQKAITKCGILQPVVQLAIYSMERDVQSTALYTLAYIVRDNEDSQKELERLRVTYPPAANSATYDPPRSVLVSLIAILVQADTKKTYGDDTRLAATHTIFAMVNGNKDMQVAIASTLKMPPEDNENTQLNGRPYSAGSLLLEVIQDWKRSMDDPHKVWFACTALSYIINNNEEAKKVANSINIGEEDEGEEPVPLLHHVVSQLYDTNIPQISAAYLCLLSVWLYNSPESVKSFLTETSHFPALIEQAQRAPNVVSGLAVFLLGIVYQYNNDPKAPVTREKLWEMLSTRYVDLCSHIQRLMSNPIANISLLAPEERTLGQKNEPLPLLVLDDVFKSFLKQNYDNVRESLRRTPKEIKSIQANDNRQIIELEEKIGQLENQEVLLKKRVTDLEINLENKNNESKAALAALEKEQERVAELEKQQESLTDKIAELESRVETFDEIQTKLAKLEDDQEPLLSLIDFQESAIRKYKERLGEPVSDTEDEGI